METHLLVGVNIDDTAKDKDDTRGNDGNKEEDDDA